MRRLPPMNSIRAFEAAVRLGNFTAAAGELGVTQSAISHRIRVIESSLGVKLFKVAGRGLEPTARARQYAMELRACLDRIGLVTEQIAEPASSHIVHVNSTHAFAMRWLIPRLPEFHALHPEIDVRISTAACPLEQLVEPFDVVFRRYAMEFPGYECKTILHDVRLPVCSPDVVARRPIRIVADLAGHTLLRANRSVGAWDEWLALAGKGGKFQPHSLYFENFFLVLHAANEGLGLALAPRKLVARDLAQKRLVAPFREPVVACEPIQVLYPAIGNSVGQARIFVDWLEDQADCGPDTAGRPRKHDIGRTETGG